MLVEGKLEVVRESKALTKNYKIAYNWRSKQPTSATEMLNVTGELDSYMRRKEGFTKVASVDMKYWKPFWKLVKTKVKGVEPIPMSLKIYSDDANVPVYVFTIKVPTTKVGRSVAKRDVVKQPNLL